MSDQLVEEGKSIEKDRHIGLKLYDRSKEAAKNISRNCSLKGMKITYSRTSQELKHT